MSVARAAARLAPAGSCAAAASVCGAAEAAALAPAPCTRRRPFHSSAAAAYDARPVLSFNHVEPPSPEAAAAIIEARRRVFGIVQGNGKRSGRKILRANLYGPTIRGYYPLTNNDLQLGKVGIYNPQQEEVYRTEETNKRLGKGRKAAKLRGPVAAFVDRMKLEDLEDGVLDQVDWFAAQDALPDEDDAVGFLAREVGMTPAEVAFFLPALNEAVALEAEVNAAEAAAEGGAAAAGGDAKGKGAKTQRDRGGFRKGRDDKSLKMPSTRDGEAADDGDDGDDASDRLTPEEKAALAAEVEALKPALAAWREKHASKLQAHYTRALAAAKEEALARGEADAFIAGSSSDDDLGDLFGTKGGAGGGSLPLGELGGGAKRPAAAGKA